MSRPAEDRPPAEPDQSGASRRALRLARIIDRACRVPGRYVIVIDVPAHRRAEWSVEVARLEIIARWAAGRE